jgi:hypothetical protein
MTEADSGESRWCYYIPEDQYDEHGYIPSIVTEGQPGHAPLAGNGTASRPWYWGKTLEEAIARCTAENAALGISPRDALDMLFSSMQADPGTAV